MNISKDTLYSMLHIMAQYGTAPKKAAVYLEWAMIVLFKIKKQVFG